MTPEQFFDQIMAAVRRTLPRWVPRKDFDAFVQASRDQLVARIARSPRFARARGPLALGAARELEEHPWAGPEVAARIAADHLRKRPDFYGPPALPAAPAANVRPRPDHSEARSFLLTIGNRFSGHVSDLPTASQVYSEIRDRSGEGSTFPPGHLIGEGRELRISYNGRIWDGDRKVYDPIPSSPAPVGRPVIDTTAVEVKPARPKTAKPSRKPSAGPSRATAATKTASKRADASTSAPSFFDVPSVDGQDLDVTVDGRALKTATKLVRKVAKSGPVCVLAAGDALYLVASVEEQWFTAKLAASVRREGHSWFAGSDLGALSTTAGAVALRVDNRRLSVNGAFAAVASETPGTGLPERVRERSDDVIWSAADLRLALETVEPFVSRDPSRVNLHSALMDPGTGGTAMRSGATFVSTDGHRLTRFQSGLATPPHQFMWPLAVLGAAPTVLAEAGQVRLSLDNDRVQGLARTATLAGGTADVAWVWIIGGAIVVFPPYTRVIPKSYDLACSIDGAVAKAALEPLLKLAKMEKAKMPSTTWDITATTLRVRYRAVGLGEEMEANIPLACRVSKDKQGTTVGLNLFYLNDVLSLPAFRGTLKLGADLPDKNELGSLNPVGIEATGDTWSATAIVMPTRL